MLLRHHLTRLLAAKKISDPSTLNVSFAVEQGLCLTNPVSLDRFINLLDQYLPDLVIVDTLIRVHNAEENSASAMAQVFDTIRKLKLRYKCAFIFADHQRKPGMSHTAQEFMLRGSGDKVAAVDTLLSIQKDGEDRIVEHSKSRYCQPIPTFGFRINDTPGDGTILEYINDPLAAQKALRQKGARGLIANLLKAGEKGRQEILDQGKAIGIVPAVLDETLRDMEAEGIVKRDRRKDKPGRGAKQVFFSLNPPPVIP
jgi:DNA-binding Lrp family transcriptional regulator